MKVYIKLHCNENVTLDYCCIFRHYGDLKCICLSVAGLAATANKGGSMKGPTDSNISRNEFSQGTFVSFPVPAWRLGNSLSAFRSVIFVQRKLRRIVGHEFLKNPTQTSIVNKLIKYTVHRFQKWVYVAYRYGTWSNQTQSTVGSICGLRWIGVFPLLGFLVSLNTTLLSVHNFRLPYLSQSAALVQLSELLHL